ncbi:serine hydrolase domain-containing protein [Nonomuraea sp. NPDC059194]|uniref:serine hydrolase domain-containing protein n=1 Tax=Nonomuraea sp. NPDC059194 TaxID=3346764 RepID=UPI00367C3132
MKNGFALVFAVLAVGLAVVSPWPTGLGETTTGDPRLAAALRDTAPSTGLRDASVAMIENGRARFAGVGDRPITPETPFEIGSITKTLTAMMIADLAEDGVLRLSDPVEGLLPELKGTPAGKATLEELLSHRAGLPNTPAGGLQGMARVILSNFSGANPYPLSTEDVLREAAGAEIEGRGTVAYSNLGVALAGHAAARRTGTPYPDLLKKRVLIPLGMTSTVVRGLDEAPPQGAALPHRANGHRVSPWSGAGYSPAGGGVWSTTGDLTKLLTGVIAGTAPGADSARPRFDVGEGERIGLAWFTTPKGGRQITWHNGGTGGSRSYAGFDATTGKAVVVLSNTAQDVDELALRLLGIDEEEGSLSMPFLVLGIVWPLIVAFTSISTIRRIGGINRLQAVNDAVWSAVLLYLAWVTGPWERLTVLPWLAAASLFAASAVIVISRWRDLPATRERNPAAQRWSAGLSLAFATLVVAAITVPT